MIINYKSIDIIIIIVHYIGGPRIDFLQDYLFYIWQFALKYWRMRKCCEGIIRDYGDMRECCKCKKGNLEGVRVLFYVRLLHFEYYEKKIYYRCMKLIYIFIRMNMEK